MSLEIGKASLSRQGELTTRREVGTIVATVYTELAEDIENYNRSFRSHSNEKS